MNPPGTPEEGRQPPGTTGSTETVIIGGGQAGLSVGYHLGRRDRPFVILDANERIGDPWRKRWDSRSTCSPPPNTAGWRVGRSRRLPRHFRRRTR